MAVGGRSTLRILAAAVGLLFLAGTVFQLLDQFDLVAKPPPGLDAANLVDRRLALAPYRQAIWPVFLLENGLVALGFLALAGVGIALSRRASRADDRGAVLLWTLVTAGLLGGVGQLVLLGGVKATIDIAYCDCGFKEQEVVSQIWAQMVVEGAGQFVVQVASLFAAAGVVVAARLYGGRSMPDGWALLSYLLAALVVLTAILAFVGLDSLFDVTQWLTILLTGVLIPAWALWLAARFSDRELAAIEAAGGG
jgi:hypothetical protein